jgi:hypothetical protein
LSDAPTKADGDADMVLVTVDLERRKPSLSAAAEMLDISLDNFDMAFGLVPLDLERKLYAVKVRSEALPEGKRGKAYRGPYSNPKIAPFGLSKKGS